MNRNYSEYFHSTSLLGSITSHCFEKWDHAPHPPSPQKVSSQGGMWTWESGRNWAFPFTWRIKRVESTYKPSGLSNHCLSLVSVLYSDLEYFYCPLDGMLVHHRVTPIINSPAPTPGWGEALWKWSVSPKNTTQGVQHRTLTTTLIFHNFLITSQSIKVLR